MINLIMSVSSVPLGFYSGGGCVVLVFFMGFVLGLILTSVI